MEKREWKTIKEYQDILFDFYNGIAKITINRPRYRNAFTPTTRRTAYLPRMSGHQRDSAYRCRRQGILFWWRHARERSRRIYRN